VALEAAVNLQRENARYDIEPVVQRINTINKTILDALANDASHTQEQL